MASQYKSIDGRDDDISVSSPWPIIVELDLIYSMHWLAHWYGFQLNQNESSQVKPGRLSKVKPRQTEIQWRDYTES